MTTTTTETPNPACEGYCSTIATNCKGANNEFAQFGNATICEKFCEFLPSLDCRISEASAAAQDPALHCAAAGPFGVGVCGSNCENFCAVDWGICGGLFVPPYESEAACLAECSALPNANLTTYPDASVPATGLRCRMAQLLGAAANPFKPSVKSFCDYTGSACF